MKKTLLTFGLISGLLSSGMMVAALPFENQIGIDHSYYIGYTILVLSFLLVYFGIRSYRDNFSDGQITFAKAFVVGISITMITCICYVITWEIVYFNFMHDFMDKYAAYALQKARNSGASEAALQAQTLQLKHSKELYENPLINSAMTFLEPFPVGLLITLISAAILRKKAQAQPAQAPLAAAS